MLAPRIAAITLQLSTIPLCAAGEFTDAIHAYLQRYVEAQEKAQKVSGGIVVGLVDEHGSSVVSCGKLDDGTDRDVDGDTLFEIGSITKTFTTLLLEDRIERGEMELDDPVARHLPASVKVPSRSGKEITLLHLATHTSGLPREPDNLDPGRAEDPYSEYTVEQLYSFLSRHELSRHPGVGFEYSNPGIALLGHAVALKAGVDYETLLVERVLRPLEMESTRLTLPPGWNARLAIGHMRMGRAVPHFGFGALAPVGGVCSTANDMLKYVSANLGLKPGKLQLTESVRYGKRKDREPPPPPPSSPSPRPTGSCSRLCPTRSSISPARWRPGTSIWIRRSGHEAAPACLDRVIHTIYNSWGAIPKPSCEANLSLRPEIQQVLRETNSWWSAPHEVRPRPPRYERRSVRLLFEAIEREGARAQVLRGPRQVGKSTALLQVIRRLLGSGKRPTDLLLVRFDLDILREEGSLLEILRWFASEIRKRPLQENPPFHLFLDEVHKVERWDEQVKHIFDTYRPRLLVTGSSSVLVARGQRESLAGRALTVEFPPFLFREVLELREQTGIGDLPDPLSLNDLLFQPQTAGKVFEAIHRQPAQRRHSWKRALDLYYSRGGYPDLHTGAVEDDRWADYLIETVFDRVLGVDIPDLFPVDQPRLLRHIYMEVARRTGQEISQKRLAEEASAAGYKTNQPTVGRYLHYLTDALLIREFKRFPLSRKTSAKVPVKYTLTDLGVRNAIFRGAPSFESPPDTVGPLVETLVQGVLRGVGLQVHFYRHRDPKLPQGAGFDEVDFVVEGTDGALLPVEVKFRRKVEASDLSSFLRFHDEYGPRAGFVVTRDTFRSLHDRNILLIPLLDFLLAF